jgi:Acetyltransferase (GNAT) domain
LIDVRCLNTLEEVAALQVDIDALNIASAQPDPFSTFEFFENYSLHDEFLSHSQGTRLWFLTAFNAGHLVGYLALKLTRHKVLGRYAGKLEFLVTHDADRPHLVARPHDAMAVSVAFYDYMLKRKKEWSFLEFSQQDATSVLFPPPAAVDLKGYRVSQWCGLENGTIDVRWTTLDEYFKSLSKKYRTNVSRQIRKLLSAGEVGYLMSSDPQTTPHLLELYRSIESHSWKSQADAAINRHPKWLEYYQGLLGAQQPMQVSIHVLLLDNVPIAGLINGAFEKGLYALQIVYDQRLSWLTPGAAALLLGMRQAILGQYAFFNLLSGFGYYKTRWQAIMVETRNAQIYRIGTPFFWNRLLGDMKRWMVSAKSRQTPAYFNPIRRDLNELEAEQSDHDKILQLETSTTERLRYAELISRIRLGQGDFLSKAELAAALPAQTQRVVVVKEKRIKSQSQ